MGNPFREKRDPAEEKRQELRAKHKNELQALYDELDKKVQAGEITPEEKFQEIERKYNSYYWNQRPEDWFKNYYANEKKIYETASIKAKEDEAMSFFKDMYEDDKEFQQGLFDLATEQFNWQKDLATQADQRREGTVKEMMEDAELRPEDVSREVGKAASDVSTSYDKAIEAENRGLTRIGIDPTSGRYASSNRLMTLDKARAVGGAKGLTRNFMKTQSDQKRQNAQLANLGLTPVALGVNDPRLGMQTPGMVSGSQYAGSMMGLAGSRQSQSNWDRQFGLQQEQLGLSRDYLNLARSQADWDRKWGMVSDILGAVGSAGGAYYGARARV